MTSWSYTPIGDGTFVFSWLAFSRTPLGRYTPNMQNEPQVSLSPSMLPQSYCAFKTLEHNASLKLRMRLSREWGEELEEFLGENGRKDAIDAIMANRHLIAHGQDAGITVVRVKEYLDKCIQVLEFIEMQCGL